jgi:hypothetical protein
MMMKINEFIKKNLKVTNHSRDSLMNHMLTSTRLPKIVCTDGFEMSVQVGFSLYSTPKKVAKRYPTRIYKNHGGWMVWLTCDIKGRNEGL